MMSGGTAHKEHDMKLQTCLGDDFSGYCYLMPFEGTVQVTFGGLVVCLGKTSLT